MGLAGRVNHSREEVFLIDSSSVDILEGSDLNSMLIIVNLDQLLA